MTVDEIMSLDYIVRLVRKEDEEDKGRLQLYGIGEYYLAVGSNADRLYMLFGWDLSVSEKSGEDNEVSSEEDRIPYIVVNTDGVAFLKKRGLSFDVVSIGWVYDNKELSVTCVQQSLDLFRATLGKEDGFTLPLVGQTVELNMPSYNRVARMTSLTVKPNSINVVLDGKEQYNILEDNVWNFDSESASLILAMSTVVEKHGELLRKLALNSREVIESVRENNAKSYRLYASAKASKENALVLVKEKGFFITFDDDAVMLSNETGGLLYNCDCQGKERHTVSVITPNHFVELTEKDLTIYVTNGTGRQLYDYLLTDSFMNREQDSRFEFTKAAIYKRGNGDYAIRATCMDKELPEATVPLSEANYCQSLEKGSLEKRRYLSALCHYAYDSFLIRRIQPM